MRSSSRLLVTATALGALALPALTSGAATKRFSGKVASAGPVTFQVRAGKVSRFQASMSASCVSAAAGRGTVEVYVIAPAGAAKLGRKGAFRFAFKLPKQQFTDETGAIIRTLYTVEGTVAGKVTGGRASGTAKVTYSQNWLSGSRIVIAACTTGPDPVRWTANAR